MGKVALLGFCFVSILRFRKHATWPLPDLEAPCLIIALLLSFPGISVPQTSYIKVSYHYCLSSAELDLSHTLILALYILTSSDPCAFAHLHKMIPRGRGTAMRAQIMF